MEDKELLAKYRSTKDLSYISTLYQRYMSLVFGSCLKYFKDQALAEDAVMDIYEKIIKKTLTSDVQYFKSWLYTVTRNHCLEQLRRKTTHAEKENRANIMYTEEVFHLDTVEREEEINALHKCLGQLEGLQKKCVELFYFNKMTYAEIGKQLDLQFGQVRSRIQNGRRNLKRCMEGSQKKKK